MTQKRKKLSNSSESFKNRSEDIVADEPKQAEAAPKKLETTAPVPAPPQNLVPLRVFARVSGVKWDQMAGFLAHAKSRKLGPSLPIVEWRLEYQNFLRKPVK